eukprot:scaffold1596_cov302-Pinguiococcus_pyrenoidosus.AAC.62
MLSDATNSSLLPRAHHRRWAPRPPPWPPRRHSPRTPARRGCPRHGRPSGSGGPWSRQFKRGGRQHLIHRPRAFRRSDLRSRSSAVNAEGLRWAQQHRRNEMRVWEPFASDLRTEDKIVVKGGSQRMECSLPSRGFPFGVVGAPLTGLAVIAGALQPPRQTEADRYVPGR